MSFEWRGVVGWDWSRVDRLWEMIDESCILCYEHSHRRYLNCICINLTSDFLVPCFVEPPPADMEPTIGLSGVDSSIFLLRDQNDRL